MDVNGDAPARIAATCGAPVPAPGRLATLAARARAAAAVDAWTEAGCYDALRFAALAKPPFRRMKDDEASAATGAIQAAVRALTADPADVRAADLLAILGLEVTHPSRAEWSRTLMEDLAPFLLAAVRSGKPTAIVRRACADFHLNIEDWAGSRYCMKQGLAAGLDSAWYLRRASWLESRRGDSLAAALRFDDALRTARDAGSTNELATHVAFLGTPLSSEESGFDLGRVWPSSDQIRAAWDSIEANARPAWLREMGRTRLSRYAATYEGLTMRGWQQQQLLGAKLFRCPVVSTKTIPFHGIRCTDTRPAGYAVIAGGARMLRVWDPTDGATPVMLLTIGVASTSAEPASITVDVRTWYDGEGRLADSSARLARGVVPSTGRTEYRGTVVLASGRPPDAWTVTATPGGRRLGRVSSDSVPGPLGGAVALSDLMIGAEGDPGLIRGNDTIPLDPWGRFDRDRRLALRFQVRRSVAGAMEATLSLAPIKDGVEHPIVISIGQAVEGRAGITEQVRSIDLSRIPEGRYRVRVTVVDRKNPTLTASSSAEIQIGG